MMISTPAEKRLAEKRPAPATIQDVLATLDQSTVSRKTVRNLLVCTWNKIALPETWVKNFSQVTRHERDEHGLIVRDPKTAMPVRVWNAYCVSGAMRQCIRDAYPYPRDDLSMDLASVHAGKLILAVANASLTAEDIAEFERVDPDTEDWLGWRHYESVPYWNDVEVRTHENVKATLFAAIAALSDETEPSTEEGEGPSTEDTTPGKVAA